jgi:hypothetical protein
MCETNFLKIIGVSTNVNTSRFFYKKTERNIRDFSYGNTLAGDEITFHRMVAAMTNSPGAELLDEIRQKS